MTTGEKHIMFRNRLVKVYRHLHKLARKQQISCFRIYDRDLPEFPLIIDIYDQHVLVTEYQSHHNLSEDAYEQWWEGCLQIIAEVLERSLEQIYEKSRHRKAGRLGQYQRMGEEQAFYTVEEGGLKFRVNLSDYLDTGLFLDHRITRGLVKEQAAGKRVLNLFCYTGSFSVYAAAGNAAEVISVDLSNTYLNWARENFVLNGFEGPQYDFVKADVKQFLPSLPANRFDLVVMDPPTFSNSKMMKDFLDIQRDHADLLNQVLRTLVPGGKLYFSTNYRKFILEKEKIAASVIKDITKATTPFDFQSKLLRWCYLFEK